MPSVSVVYIHTFQYFGLFQTFRYTACKPICEPRAKRPSTMKRTNNNNNENKSYQKRHTRELISARKTSQKQNNKDMNCPH